MGRLRSRPRWWMGGCDGPGVATYYVLRGKQSPVGGYTIANRRQGRPVAYRTATRERIRYYDSRLSLWVGYVCFRLASAAYEPTSRIERRGAFGGDHFRHPGARRFPGFQVSFVVGHAWHARSRDQTHNQSLPAAWRNAVGHLSLLSWVWVFSVTVAGRWLGVYFVLCALLPATPTQLSPTNVMDGKVQCLDKHPPTSSCLVNNMRRPSFFRLSTAGWSGSHGNLRVLSTTNEAAPPNTINICRQHHPAFTTTQLCASDIPRKAHSCPPFRDGSPIVTALLSRRSWLVPLVSLCSPSCIFLSPAYTSR